MRTGRRIPQQLWALAVRLVSRHGVSRTAAALGLDYYSLKKQADSGASEPESSRPAFVELPPPVVLTRQCQFELDNGLGATLRLQQAAQGEVLHNDDTTVKILELMGRGRHQALTDAEGEEDDADGRSGLFTSGVVALRDEIGRGGMGVVYRARESLELLPATTKSPGGIRTH